MPHIYSKRKKPTISKKGRKRLGIIRSISGATLFLSLIFILGVAGASDLDLISLKTMVIRSIIGCLTLMFSGYVFSFSDAIITNCKVRRERRQAKKVRIRIFRERNFVA